MSHRYEKLITPFQLPNGVWLKNHMVHPKCCPDQNQGPEEWPTEQFATFHRDAAKRGNSLVILCDAFRPEVRKMPAWHDFSHSYTFNLDDPGVHNYFCQLADDIHYYGSKVIVQVRPEFPRGTSVGGGNPPRMQSAEGFMPLPREGTMATKEQIKEAIDQAVERIKLYQSWGYDGVAVDANGLAKYTDLRTDEYGGCIENRCRFSLEYFEAIKKACGRKFIIHLLMPGESLYGFSGELPNGSGYTIDDTIVLLKKCEEKQLVDLVSIREDSMCTSHPTGFTFQPEEHHCLDYIKTIKAAGVTLPLAACGGFQDPGEMERLLESGAADLISIGRGMFTDDEYYTKVCEERGEDIRPCVRCNRCHGRRRAPWTSVCTVNPEFGMELKTRHMVKPVTHIKKVAVIGAGVAGMQAAITAAERGHSVVLFEKSGYLGGQLEFGDHFDFKWPFKEFRLWMVRRLGQLKVEIRLNTEPSPEQITAEGFDAVIAATGAVAKVPDIEGMHNPDGSAALRTCHDVIGKEETVGKNVIMVGCSETGIETACYLAKHGHNVTCLTRQNQLAKDASPLHSITIAYVKVEEDGMAWMAPYWTRFDNLTGITNATTIKVTDKTVTYVDAEGAEHTLEGDEVIVCGGVEPCMDSAVKYATAAREFYMVGDVYGGGDIQRSVRNAFAAASQI